jgi:outer membrane protein assembly factor BamB
VDIVTGEPAWTVETEGSVLGSAAVSDAVVYAGTSRGVIYALDVCSGSVVWRASVSGRVGSPVLEDGVVYVATGEGALVSLDARSGAVLTTFDVGSDVNRKPHAVADGVMFVVTVDRHLHAVDMGVGADG